MLNKKLKSYLIVTLIFLLCTIEFGCKNNSKSNRTELLIYCGITMVKPIAEIAKIIENKYNCKIIITKGGSGNLLQAIKINGVGDLYLPGCDSYIKTCLDEKLIKESVFVGHNKAAMMIQKGNPKNITADLDNLMKKDYYIVIGNPESGSIGRETKKILENKKIFNQVIANAHELTTDSKRLVAVLKEKTADIVINWYATSVWDENIQYIDALEIDEKYAKKKRLVLGLLETSKNKDIARKFMEYAKSKEGIDIFRKHGFYDVK